MTAEQNTPTPDVAAPDVTGMMTALNAHINGIMPHVTYKPITVDEQRAIGERRDAIEVAARDACVTYAEPYVALVQRMVEITERCGQEADGLLSEDEWVWLRDAQAALRPSS